MERQRNPLPARAETLPDVGRAARQSGLSAAVAGVDPGVLLLYLPAGSVRHWEAWQCLAMMLNAASLMVVYLLITRSNLLERRLRMRKKEPQQQWIARAAAVWFVVTYLVTGLGQRFGWSDVPAGVMIAADPGVLLGYGVIFSVFRANPYASRIIEVEPDQQLVSTGPDAVVRHPMYFGGLLIHVAAPLTLGSCWVLWPAALIVTITIARIRTEERLLARDRRGYQDYLGAPGTGWCQGFGST